jgi:hypothetical protein
MGKREQNANAIEKLLSELNAEAFNLRVIGEYHNRHGDLETGSRYLAESTAHYRVVAIVEAVQKHGVVLRDALRVAFRLAKTADDDDNTDELNELLSMIVMDLEYTEHGSLAR